MSENLIETVVAEGVVDVVEQVVAKGKRGRKPSELGLRVRVAIEAALSEQPKSRSQLVATLLDAAEREFADGNWQTIIGHLLDSGVAKRADSSPARGRGVAYVKA